MNEILTGLLTTTTIFFAAMFGSVFLGGILYGLQNTPLKRPVVFVIEILRNTPLLIQLFFIYYLSSAWSALACGIVVLSLQTGAYVAETLRAGFQAIPATQYDAGLSLGFSSMECWQKILLPQAWASMLPTLGNLTISLMKNTAIVSFISVPDLFYMLYQGSAEQFAYMQYFALGIVLYLVFSLIITAVFALLEKYVPWREPLPAYLLGEPG